MNWSGPLYRLAISILISLSFTYSLAFDYLPGQVRLGSAGLIAAGYIALSLERVLFSRDPAIRWMFMGATLIVLAWATGALVDPFNTARASASLATGFRNISGLLSGIAILGFAHRINPRLILSGFVALIVIAAAIAVARPGVNLGGMVRLAPFTGGETGLHSSAYTVALASLGIFYAWRTRALATVIALPILLLGTWVLLGYEVRTAFVLLTIAALVASFQAMTGRIRYLAPTLISFGLAGLFLALLFLFSFMDGGLWKDLSNFSSGRLATYAERISGLIQRDIPGHLFGSGPGSDVSFSRQWYWGAKDSHNDFLRHFKEDGLIGATGVALYLIGIFRFARFDGLPFVLCLIGSSAISNALLARPTIIVFFFMTLVLLFHGRSSSSKTAWDVL